MRKCWKKKAASAFARLILYKMHGTRKSEGTDCTKSVPCQRGTKDENANLADYLSDKE
jgi:hypothetical protein